MLVLPHDQQTPRLYPNHSSRLLLAVGGLLCDAVTLLCDCIWQLGKVVRSINSTWFCSERDQEACRYCKEPSDTMKLVPRVSERHAEREESVV